MKDSVLPASGKTLTKRSQIRKGSQMKYTKKSWFVNKFDIVMCMLSPYIIMASFALLINFPRHGRKIVVALIIAKA